MAINNTVRKAVLLGAGHKGGNVFDRNSKLNRDNSLSFNVYLREKLKEHGIELFTADQVSPEEVSVEIHENDFFEYSGQAKRILILLEDELVVPRNIEKFREFDFILSWDHILGFEEKTKKLNFSNEAEIDSPMKSFSERQLFLTNISSNKCLKTDSKLDLYTQRVKAINFFQRSIGDQFCHFGHGWDAPAASISKFGKAKNKLKKIWYHLSGEKPFPSYRGAIENKGDVYRNAKFSICFENVQRENYITEKIFDCFRYGVVPIYWGAPNILDYIPKRCFIDFRDFDSFRSLLVHLQHINKEEFSNIQEDMVDYMKSAAFEKFSVEANGDAVVEAVLSVV